MKTIALNQKEFPTLSTWDPNFLEEILENLAKTANPSKTEILEADKLWAATMLEMDLQAETGSIYQQETEMNPLEIHNKTMLKKMKEEKTNWTEDY